MKKLKYFILRIFKKCPKEDAADDIHIKKSDSNLRINKCEVKKINFKINE